VKYPTFTFTARSGRVRSPGQVEVTGDLVIRGRTRPLTLPASIGTTATSVTLSTEVEIDRSLWGVSWAKMGAGLQNRVVITAYFDRA
jgi:polyisoprenoid-binding protein YceI